MNKVADAFRVISQSSVSEQCNVSLSDKQDIYDEIIF